MNKAYIKFNSITYAQLASEALLKYSIRSQLGRLSVKTNNSGCGYILYPSCDISYALEILRRENVKNLGIGRSDGL